jgi:hypothetical protein
MDSPKIITRIRHQSIPAYLSAMRSKVNEFGRETLTTYEEPKALVLGFQCGDEVHLVGLNNIRAYYNIERILPNIPGLVSWRRNSGQLINEKAGIDMFVADCKKALNGLKNDG